MGLTTETDRLILVDKETQDAQFIRVVNDFLGNWDTPFNFWNLRNGYFAHHMEPIEMQELLEEALERDDLEPDVRQRMIQLYRQLDPNANDVLMIGRLR